MTAALEAEYRARLDFSAASHCGNGEPSLLGERLSGQHPLVRGRLLHGITSGDLTDTTWHGRAANRRHQRAGIKRDVIAVECAEAEAKRRGRTV